MPLKPIRITVNLPAEIADLVKRRVREEKYPSDSAYFVGLALFDLYARRPAQHWFTKTGKPYRAQVAAFTLTISRN